MFFPALFCTSTGVFACVCVCVLKFFSYAFFSLLHKSSPGWVANGGGLVNARPQKGEAFPAGVFQQSAPPARTETRRIDGYNQKEKK